MSSESEALTEIPHLMSGLSSPMSDDERKTTMNIIEKHVYQSATLPGAPERATRTEAEADEARGVELAAYLALLPGLTAEQWVAARVAARDAGRDAARDAGWDAAWDAARDAAWDAARDAGWDAGRAGEALVVRDLISAEHFDILTAPMRAAGIDFDNLAPHE